MQKRRQPYLEPLLQRIAGTGYQAARVFARNPHRLTVQVILDDPEIAARGGPVELRPRHDLAVTSADVVIDSFQLHYCFPSVQFSVGGLSMTRVRASRSRLRNPAGEPDSSQRVMATRSALYTAAARTCG